MVGPASPSVVVSAAVEKKERAMIQAKSRSGNTFEVGGEDTSTQGAQTGPNRCKERGETTDRLWSEEFSVCGEVFVGAGSPHKTSQHTQSRRQLVEVFGKR